MSFGYIGRKLWVDRKKAEDVRQDPTGLLLEFFVQINSQIVRCESFCIPLYVFVVEAKFKKWIQQLELVGFVAETLSNLFSKRLSNEAACHSLFVLRKCTVNGVSEHHYDFGVGRSRRNISGGGS